MFLRLKETLLYFQFQHPDFGELQRDDFLWSLSNVPLLKGYLQAVVGDPLKEVVEGVIHQYRTSVIPKQLPSLCSLFPRVPLPSYLFSSSVHILFVLPIGILSSLHMK